MRTENTRGRQKRKIKEIVSLRIQSNGFFFEINKQMVKSFEQIINISLGNQQAATVCHILANILRVFSGESGKSARTRSSQQRSNEHRKWVLPNRKKIFRYHFHFRPGRLLFLRRIFVARQQKWPSERKRNSRYQSATVFKSTRYSCSHFCYFLSVIRFNSIFLSASPSVCNFSPPSVFAGFRFGSFRGRRTECLKAPPNSLAPKPV